jgi:ATP-GRASP peptide maturase of grasp-with-spasm system
MVLILSDESDLSTIDVIRWLDYYSHKWIRIGLDNKISVQSLHMDGSEYRFVITTERGEIINSEELTSYWYRRGALQFNYHSNFEKIENLRLRTTISNHIQSELGYLREGIYHILSKLKHINDFRNSDVNKIIILDLAKKVGLNTPETLITTDNSKLEMFRNSSSIISKAIQNGARFEFRENQELVSFLCYTEDFGNNEYCNSFPSLFQHKLEKEYELRVFYLEGSFYSMAIFSQTDSQTETDFRKYNLKKPNRTIPYQLPKDIEIKLGLLMKHANLNSGSIDMIYTKNGEYVFLEVNPVGQFGMVSKPCNFNIEEKIAKFLIE